MSLRPRSILLIAAACAAVWTPLTVRATSCSAEWFTVRIFVESCTPTRFSPKYGYLLLRLEATTKELRKSKTLVQDPVLPGTPKPEAIAPLNKRRTYLTPTGNGVLGSPRKILICEDVMKRELEFVTSACGCESQNCQELFLETLGGMRLPP